MNKHNFKKIGTSHLYIPIVVVIIVGVIGYLFWNNVLNQTTDEASTKSTSNEMKSSVAMKEGKTIGFPKEISWSYPETWTLKREGVEVVSPQVEAAQSQLITVTSPTKEFEVVYELYYNGGFGGSCVSLSDGGSDGFVLDFTKQKALSLADTFFIDAIVDSYSDNMNKPMMEGYKRISGLAKESPSQPLSEVKVGSSVCKIQSATLLSFGTNPNINLSTKIRMNGVEEFDNNGALIATKNIKTLKDQYLENEYKDAVKILLSTQIK